MKMEEFIFHHRKTMKIGSMELIGYLNREAVQSQIEVKYVIIRPYHTFPSIMNYSKFTYLFPFSFSIENLPAAIIFGVSFLIILGLLIHFIIKKFSTNETLKYEFITIVAHKFRTPLTHVKWSADALLEKEQDPYKRQSIEDIQQSNEKLIKLTNTLIELTDSDNDSTSTYAFEKVLLCEFVKTIGDEFKDAFHEKNIFFSIQCPKDDFFVKIDRQRMEFVLQALLENALIYTSTGKNVEVYIAKSGHKANISITDHGIGIDEKDIPNIFGKFFRAENARMADTEGFGVGLYLAQAVTNRHKGAIKAYSGGIGTGSTFTITLPVSR